MTVRALDETRSWVDDFVVGLDLCPFASNPFRAGRVRFVTCPDDAFERQLAAFLAEVDHLVRTPAVEVSNTLIVFSEAPSLANFELFLDLCAAAEAVLADLEAEHLVQLATFHPDYCFDGAEPDDPANATNQAPYPTLHLLRVDEVEEAIARHPDIDAVSLRNARLLRSRDPGR